MGIMEDDIKGLEEQLKKARAELWLLHQISNAMRATLNLREILYIILSAVTSHEGLGFNRAMLFLVSADKRTLEGTMAIGPANAEEAQKIWHYIETDHLGLDRLIDMYHNIESQVVKAPLNNNVKDICLPLVAGEGILTECVLEGMNFEVTEEALRKKIDDPALDKLKADLFVCVPLKGKQQIQGALLVDNMITKKLITKDDTRVLTMFANQAGLAIDNAQLYESVKFQAHTDSLTRLWNHGHFQDSLEELLKEIESKDDVITLVMIDIDNFKEYNDTLGHQKGDVALREVASIFKTSMRSNDLVCRYGGEEFAIIMPDINKSKAYNIIERVRKRIEKTFRREKKEAEPFPFTISSGIASFPHDATDKETLIKKADEALYKAKHSGKNITVFFQ